MAVIDVHSSLGWQSSGFAWECLTAVKKAHYLRNMCSLQNDYFPLYFLQFDV